MQEPKVLKVAPTKISNLAGGFLGIVAQLSHFGLKILFSC
jgi:hypothetical protein